MVAIFQISGRPEFNTSITDSYCSLIERCWSQDPKDRPSFEEIVNELKTDSGYIILSKVEFQLIWKNQQSIVKWPPIKVMHWQCIIMESNFQLVKALIWTKRKLSNTPKWEYNYPYINYNGDEVDPINKKESFKYYKMAADNGDLTSMFHYALMNYKGEVEPVNIKESLKYFRMAADKGNADSMRNYAVINYNGEGVPVNFKEAASYYKMAADRGNVKLMCKYAYMRFKR